MLSESDITFARTRAERYWTHGVVKSPQVHVFQSDSGWHALLVNASQLFDISRDIASAFQNASAVEEQALMERLGLLAPAAISDDAIETPKLHALSLAIAQKCNLACTYCYAEQGSFGEKPQNMSLDTAKRAVDLLLQQAQISGKANLAFLGGEPLVNRKEMRACVEYAAQQARALQVKLGFSITTNGTLLGADDADFFEQHAFAVTISLDGNQSEHDQLRPFKSALGQTGKGSFARIMQRVQPLLALQKRMQVTARVTVTPHNQALPEVLQQFVNAGFHSVGFSPMLRSPTGRDELHPEQLRALLGQMIACAELAESHWLAGRRFPFANLLNAMKEIGKGTHRPYPCGAGAGYMGVSADGALSACHRFVGDPIGSLGNLHDGIDREAQASWLKQRHVHTQSPCKDCWARYLCGGGCHHEVIARGRTSCDYIRGWLQYCLEAYVRLSHLPMFQR